MFEEKISVKIILSSFAIKIFNILLVNILLIFCRSKYIFRV